jgi:hypothetical protein
MKNARVGMSFRDDLLLGHQNHGQPEISPALQKRLVLLQSSLQVNQSPFRNPQILRSDNIRPVSFRPVRNSLASLKHQSNLCTIRTPHLLVLLQRRGHKSRAASGDVDPGLQVVLESALRSVEEGIFGRERHLGVGQDSLDEETGVILNIASEWKAQRRR